MNEVGADADAGGRIVKYLSCARCSRGCHLTVSVCGDRISVAGNACSNGEDYGRQEAMEPLRPLLTTVATDNPDRPRLAVRSERDFPLSRVLEAMEALDVIIARAPLKTGDVLVENLLGTGIRIVARADLPLTSGR